MLDFYRRFDLVVMHEVSNKRFYVCSENLKPFHQLAQSDDYNIMAGIAEWRGREFKKCINRVEWSKLQYYTGKKGKTLRLCCVC